MAGALMFQFPAFAQSDSQMREAIDVCRRVPELSARLACYDGAFAPIADNPARNAAPPSTPPRPTAAAAPTPTAAPPADPIPPAGRNPDTSATVSIVALERPDLRTTRFIAADGRVFVRTDTSILRWPDVPFDAELQRSRFGTLYLKILPMNSRVRVAVEQ